MSQTSYPVHPGLDFRQEVIDKRNLSEKAAAKLLGVSQGEINNIVNGRRSLTPNICERVAMVFGENAKDWAARQLNYDLQQAKQKIGKLNLQLYKPKP